MSTNSCTAAEFSRKSTNLLRKDFIKVSNLEKQGINTRKTNKESEKQCKLKNILGNVIVQGMFPCTGA